MVTFWERAAHVNRVFSLLCPFVALVVSHFGVQGRQDLGSVCVSSWSLLTLYFFINNHVQTASKFYDLNMDFVV